MATVVFNVTVEIADDDTRSGEERVTEFATNRGWVATIAGQPDANGNPTTVPNPQTADEACCLYFKRILTEQITQDRVNQLNADLNAQRQAGLAQLAIMADEMITITTGE